MPQTGLKTLAKGLLFPSYFIFLLLGINIYRTFEKEGEEENPGFYNQWFNEKKNAQGIIPALMRQKWAAWDRNNGLITNRAGNPIETVTQLGPNNTGGRTRALWVHPTNENIMLAGGISGGIWRSTDKGASWSAINDQEVSLMPSCIDANPQNPNTIIYGTGESRANSADVDGNGIYRSYDGGKTFKVIASTANKTLFNAIWDVKYSLDDTNVIFVATNNNGLLRTDDGGQTWSTVMAVSGAKQVNHLVVMPGGKILCSAYGNNFYYSNQNGITGSFTAISSLPNKPAAGTYGRVQIAGCKKYPNVVYALYSDVDFSDGPMAFYKSSDSGRTWKQLTTPTNIDASYSNYTLMLGVNPNDSNKIVAGAVYIMQSSDGGNTWASKVTGHSDHHAYAPILTKPDEFLVGTDGGVFLYKWSAGAATDLNKGYISTQFYAGAFGPSGLVAISGAQDNGTHVTNGPLSTIKAYGADGGYCHIGLQTGSVAYLSTQNQGIRRISSFVSTVAGSSVAIDDSRFTSDGVDFVNSYALNPADESQLYYRTARGLYRSSTSGELWDYIMQRGNIKAIAVENAENPVVYCGGGGSALYRLKSAGTVSATGNDKVYTNTAPSSVSSDFINCINIHPYDNNTILVAYSNNSNNARLWKVTGFDQNSVKWTNISGNLPVGLPVNYVAQDPSRPMEMMFAGTDFGLYYTTDSGKTWSKETRIPNVAVFEVKMREDRTLFVFTHGRGIFSIKLTADSKGSAGIKTHSANSEFKVYPNPAASSLSFKLPNVNESFYCRIYDMNARLLIEKNMNPGINHNLDISSLNNGQYFIRIQYANKTLTQKFSVIK